MSGWWWGKARRRRVFIYIASAGTDLGILNIATNLPQALSQAIAGLIITSLDGYAMHFVFEIIFSIVAALATIPIKSVR